MIQHAHASTVADLERLYLAHAADYYRRADGTPTRETNNLASTLRAFRRLVGPEQPAATIDRTHLRHFQATLIGENLTRTYINASIGRLHRCFAWAVENDLLPTRVLDEFRAVGKLKPHRSRARETEPRRPAPAEAVAATMAFLPATPRAIVALLAITGARAGEIVALRQQDIDDDDPDCWTAIPTWHKTAHYGRRRVLLFDRRAQAIIEPWRRPFLPLDPVFPSPRNPGAHFTVGAVTQAVRRGAKRAGVEPWTPHQLRHAVGHAARRAVGLDGAQALLGHASRNTTERYAAPPMEAARKTLEALAAIEREQRDIINASRRREAQR